MQILCLRKISGVTGATRAGSKQGFLCAEYENIAMCKIFVFGQSSGQMGTTRAVSKQGTFLYLKKITLLCAIPKTNGTPSNS